MEATVAKRSNRPMSFEEAILAIRSSNSVNLFPIVLYPTFESGQVKSPSKTSGKLRRTSVKWSKIEQEFLLNGLRKFDKCWTQILKEYPIHPIRTRCDLKDKWNVLLRHESEPDCTAVFQSIEKCRKARNDFLSTMNPEKEADGEDVSKTLNSMKGIMPARHIPAIRTLLRDPSKKQIVTSEWNNVKSNPGIVFSFLKKIYSLLRDIQQRDTTD